MKNGFTIDWGVLIFVVCVALVVIFGCSNEPTDPYIRRQSDAEQQEERSRTGLCGSRSIDGRNRLKVTNLGCSSYCMYEVEYEGHIYFHTRNQLVHAEHCPCKRGGD